MSEHYKKIQKHVGNAWIDVEFEFLQAGDEFKVILPPGDSAVYTCVTNPVPIEGEPGNWGIRVNKAVPIP